MDCRYLIWHVAAQNFPKPDTIGKQCKKAKGGEEAIQMNNDPTNPINLCVVGTRIWGGGTGEVAQPFNPICRNGSRDCAPLELHIQIIVPNNCVSYVDLNLNNIVSRKRLESGWFQVALIALLVSIWRLRNGPSIKHKTILRPTLTAKKLAGMIKKNTKTIPSLGQIWSSMDNLDGSWTLWSSGGQNESNGVVKVAGKGTNHHLAPLLPDPATQGVGRKCRIETEETGREAPQPSSSSSIPLIRSQESSTPPGSSGSPRTTHTRLNRTPVDLHRELAGRTPEEKKGAGRIRVGRRSRAAAGPGKSSSLFLCIPLSLSVCVACNPDRWG
ncbi:hypothetical protein LXL04_011201 [Taraxacum kok-saghyz]